MVRKRLVGAAVNGDQVLRAAKELAGEDLSGGNGEFYLAALNAATRLLSSLGSSKRAP
jgi:hypothetical protein